MSRALVRDLMTVGVPTCPPATPAADVARLLLDKDYEAVIVLDVEGQAVGVVGREELVRAFADGGLEGKTAEQIMHEGVPQIPPDIPLAAAAHLMADQKLRAFFLMHNAGGIIYPAALITYKHFIRLIAARSDDELSDLGIAAARQAPLDVFIEKRDATRRQSLGA